MTGKPGTLLAAAILLAPIAAQAGVGQQEGPSPLVAKIRAATAKYRDPAVAIADGYVPGHCASGPNEGAMGVHFINGALVVDGAIVNTETPEALIYEPLPGGKLRLVGVEYITFADAWTALGTTPALEGHLFHYAGAPNRYGIPAFFELHVWAWQENPKGTFSDWNPLVSCDAMPLAGN